MVLQSGGVAGRAIIPLVPGWSRWSGRLLGGYCTHSGAKAKVEEIFVDQAVSSGRSPGSPRLLRAPWLGTPNHRKGEWGACYLINSSFLFLPVQGALQFPPGSLPAWKNPGKAGVNCLETTK